MEYVCIKVFAILLVNVRSIVCSYLYVKILQQMCLTYDIAISGLFIEYSMQLALQLSRLGSANK